MKLLYIIFTAIIFLASSTYVNAAVLEFSISGTGSGSLDGINFVDSDYIITMKGDSSSFSGSIIDPLISSVVTIEGRGTTTICEDTRLGFNNSNNAVFFSRASGLDLFDFYLASPLDLTQPFSPVKGTGVFALYQFQNVDSSLGLLSFDSSCNVLFQANVSAVPEASTMTMMLGGLGFVGLLLARRKNRV